MEEYFRELERRAWESYERANRIYHVTPVENIRSLVTGGIESKSNIDVDGIETPAIWFFTDKDWAARVAISMGLSQYALFSIKKQASPDGKW